MTERKRFGFLKFEGIVFALSIIFFTVMYYFNYLSVHVLVCMLMFLAAVLFSINATIQADRTSKTVARVNTTISALLFLAGLGLTVYFYMQGFIVLG